MTSRAMTKKSRVRPTLLVLLWIWAITVFLVVDLFLNVEEFDSVRPRAPLYQAMRAVAHEMVGEPLEGADDAFRMSRGSARSAMAAELRTGLLNLGGAAPAELASVASGGADVRVRIRALELLVEQIGAEARPQLLAIVKDRHEPAKLRTAACRLLGATGDDAIADLDRIVASDEEARVRAGAVHGLARLGTAEAASRLLGIGADRKSALRLEAVKAVAELRGPDAAGALIPAIDTCARTDLAVAIVKALTRMPREDAVATLAAVASDRSRESPVRLAAMEGLGDRGSPAALEAVRSVRPEDGAELTMAARAAAQRIRNRSGETAAR